MPILTIKTDKLTRSDLRQTLEQLDKRPKPRRTLPGPTRLFYRDNYYDFRIVLEPAEDGYQVDVVLNGSFSQELIGLTFPSSTELAKVLLIAAAAPAGVSPEKFFSSQ